MTAAKLNITRVGDFNVPVKTPEGTLIGSEGIDVDFSGKDCDIILNVTDAQATVKAGNSIAGVMDLTVPAGTSVVLDSGCFKNVRGEHKGCVFVTGAGAKISAIELP